MEEKCTYEDIFSSLDRCQFVTEHCQHFSSYFNFIHFYYCELNESIPLIVLFAILFSFFVFNIFGAVSDSYLAPALEIITKRLKLSESVSGITLLAFAASAPDVVTGIVAGGKEEGGVRIAIGGLFGACLFTVTVVLAGCIKGAKVIEADKNNLKRDICVLFMMICFFIVLTIIGKITPLFAAGFFMIYILFFFYVIWEDRRKNREFLAIKENLLSGEYDKIEDKAALEEKFHQSVSDKFKFSSIHILRDAKSFDDIGRLDMNTSVMNASIMKIKLKESWRRSPSLAQINPVSGRTTKHRPLKETQSVHFELRDGLEKSEETETIIEVVEEKVGFAHKVLKVINMPILLVGDMTMPPFEAERWNRFMAAVALILGPFFVIWELGFVNAYQDKWWFWATFGAITLSIAFLVLIKGRKRNLAEEYPLIFSAITLLISIFWLNLVSTLVVDFLMFIQVVTGLSLYLLSITILAWGNSLEDYFVNYSIARKGYGRTSLGGVYGSQIFAISIGFGGGMFRMALKGTIYLDIYNFSQEFIRENIMTLFLLASNLVILLLTLVAGKLVKWVLGNKIVFLVMGFYLAFTTAVIVIAFV